ncbi:knotted carbamoyltransferase YgeW [Pelomyxa schiedti]|nr:knotted carbamoyltransferase YgeW [Pelomyxa schiedti]KAH3732613.1 knotted carbamoyltransferase YgeW [Pelomyxa schiedti]
MEKLHALVAQLQAVMANRDVALYNHDFLRTWDKTPNEISAVMLVNMILQEMYKLNISAKVFNGGLAVSNFRDKSTRTRFSFAFACDMLGLSVADMDETKSQISHGETVRETAAMISFLTQAIGIRDDIFLGEGHRYQKEVSDTVAQAFHEGVLPQIPAVVNLQCDEDHPTQAMADMSHLIEHFGGVENLRGKKLVMSWAYSPSYGKPLSVPQGVIGLMSRFGMNIVLAHPEGYDLLPEIVDIARKNSVASGGSFAISNNMSEAFVGADVVYPKSWAPIPIMQERCRLLHAGKGSGPEMAALEKRGLEESARFVDWQCTAEKMAVTKAGSALYMHCLPADITGVNCRTGEVSQDVFERYRIQTYKEAGHKPYVIAAMILLSRFPDAAGTLRKAIERNTPRMLL